MASKMEEHFEFALRAGNLDKVKRMICLGNVLRSYIKHNISIRLPSFELTNFEFRGTLSSYLPSNVEAVFEWESPNHVWVRFRLTGVGF